MSAPLTRTEDLLPRHGVATLFGYGIQVRVDRGHLLVEDGIGADRRQSRFPRVGHGLKRLVVIGSDGTVNVDLQVVRGNPIDVLLTTPDQLEAMKKEQWSQVQVYPNFNAAKTMLYRRSARLGQGAYYLVIRDTSLGILSSSASDVSIKVQLNP
jgi:hypothetical protein